MLKKLTVLALGVAGLHLSSSAQGALVAHYGMNEATGSIADSSGNNLTGTPDGTGLAYSQASVPAGTYGSIEILPTNATAFGNSIGFTRSSPTAGGRFTLGTPSQIDLLAEGGTPGSGEFTVMAWVFSQGLPASTSYRVFSTGRPGGWGLGLANVDRLRFTTFGVSDFTSAGTFPFNNNWHHIAASWSDGVLSTYVDGNLVSMTASGNTTNLIEETGPSYAIGSTDATADYFNGRIDEVRIYDTAMNQAQIIAAAVPVPEPASTAVVAVAAMGLLRRRR